MINYVPEHLNDRVINKEIVYSDYPMSIEEKGKYLKPTTLLYVDKYSIEDAIRIVLANNPKIIIHTIQYSESTKRLFLFATKELDVSSWYDNLKLRIESHMDNPELLQNIKDVLITDKPFKKGVSSLYDVSKIILKETQVYNGIHSLYESKIIGALKKGFPRCIISIHNFNKETKELSISFNVNESDKFFEMSFRKKKNGDLYISRYTPSYYKDQIFYLTADILSELYDSLLAYNHFLEQFSYNINSSNSNFKTNIGYYGVTVYCHDKSFRTKKLFSLDYTSIDNRYNCYCNSSNIISLIKGNEEELLKRIYVRIIDCPEWMRDKLYEIREQQAENEMKKYEKSLEVEESKTLQLIKKVFPFIKK